LNMRNLRFAVSCFAIANFSLISLSCDASIYTVPGFTRITSNAPSIENVASQLGAVVTDATDAFDLYGLTIGSSQVLFVFSNTGSIASSIAEVYFDDGALLAQSNIFNSLLGTTDFEGPGANPGNLPSQNTASPPFITSQAFSADVGPQQATTGVNPGELFAIAFDLKSGLGFSDIVTAFNTPATGLASDTSSLRIGFHVVAIGGSGQSDAFVSNPPPPPPPGGDPPFVPEPTSVAVWSLIASLAFVFTSRSKR
jgi:hypothetical protein